MRLPLPVHLTEGLKFKAGKEANMSVTSKEFGCSRDGRELKLYTITGKNGLTAVVTNLGAILVSLMVPDAQGNVEDVVLGFDKADDYYGNPSFFGATIGPNANRIGNAEYEIDGVHYELDINDNDRNNLHSHIENGYHKRVWDVDNDDNSVTFSIEDPATLGFPGNKKLSVTYTVTDDNELKLHYVGSSDENTILNPTNHSYFNLDGIKSGCICEHKIQIEADEYTPTDNQSIPTGEIASVKGTPMDLTSPTVIKDHIGDDFEQLNFAGGYDHNFCVRGYDGSLRKVATVWAAKSSRVMEVYSDLPGVQFYAGNFIKEGQVGKDGAVFNKRYGLCLETQFYPDAIHHENFQSPVFGPERSLDTTTIYAFK